AAVRRISAEGMTILLVEQNVVTTMQIAQRVCVLEQGRIVAEGTPQALMARPEIRRAYLGGDLAAGDALT
ncbi:MAG TPA: ABC transporter ATP-binding protein, partial [Burkholderiaceae bacterium]|nr:ABC transporter ATP-binding protein [Burkholderiaceae bacterium]